MKVMIAKVKKAYLIKRAAHIETDDLWLASFFHL
jgi:hypothetical protein